MILLGCTTSCPGLHVACELDTPGIESNRNFKRELQVTLENYMLF